MLWKKLPQNPNISSPQRRWNSRNSWLRGQVQKVASDHIWTGAILSRLRSDGKNSINKQRILITKQPFWSFGELNMLVRIEVVIRKKEEKKRNNGFKIQRKIIGRSRRLQCNATFAVIRNRPQIRALFSCLGWSPTRRKSPYTVLPRLARLGGLVLEHLYTRMFRIRKETIHHVASEVPWPTGPFLLFWFVHTHIRVFTPSPSHCLCRRLTVHVHGAVQALTLSLWIMQISENDIHYEHL